MRCKNKERDYFCAWVAVQTDTSDNDFIQVNAQNDYLVTMLRSVEHVLMSFDLDCVCFAFDGTEVSIFTINLIIPRFMHYHVLYELLVQDIISLIRTCLELLATVDT